VFGEIEKIIIEYSGVNKERGRECLESQNTTLHIYSHLILFRSDLV
jgi:hypothetical protein